MIRPLRYAPKLPECLLIPPGLIVAPPRRAMEPDRAPEAVGRGRAHPESEREVPLVVAVPIGRVGAPRVGEREPGATTRKRPSRVPGGHRGARLAVRRELAALPEQAVRRIEAIVRGPGRGHRRAQTAQTDRRAQTDQTARVVRRGRRAPIGPHDQSGRRVGTPLGAVRHRPAGGQRRPAPAHRVGGARGSPRVQAVGRPLRVAAPLVGRRRGVPLHGTASHAAANHGATVARNPAPEPGPGRHFRAPMTTKRCPARPRSGGTLRAAAPGR